MDYEFELVSGDDAVIPLPLAAHLAGLSLVTLRRAIHAGRGPTVVRPTPRRPGPRSAFVVGGEQQHHLDRRRRLDRGDHIERRLKCQIGPIRAAL
jgi:hypothetical protein